MPPCPQQTALESTQICSGHELHGDFHFFEPLHMENNGEAFNKNHPAAHQLLNFLYPRFQVARDTEACGFNPLISFFID